MMFNRLFNRHPRVGGDPWRRVIDGSRLALLRSLAGMTIILLWLPMASAHSYKAGKIYIGHPWAEAGKPAIYLSLLNLGQEPDQLLKAECSCAEKIELRETLENKKTKKVKELIIGHRQPVPMRPHGLHLYAVGLKKPFANGDKIPMVLTFKNSGKVEVEIQVQEPIE
ncbi:MAG: copper chaperone PCu(A)C [Dongiaceae bacterium]